MKSYLLVLLLFSIPASIDLAIIRKEGSRPRLIYALKSFLWMVAGSIIFGWLMYLLK